MIAKLVVLLPLFGFLIAGLAPEYILSKGNRFAQIATIALMSLSAIFAIKIFLVCGKTVSSNPQ